MSDPDHPEPGDRPDRSVRRSREPAHDPAPVDRAEEPGPDRPDGEEAPDGRTWFPV